FNGDGRLDLAVANEGSFPDYQGSLSVLLGNGDGTFQPQEQFAAGAVPSTLVAEGFDGDGRLDLATNNFVYGDVSVLLGNGAGTVQQQKQFARVHSSSLVLGDFNGDGRLDLATVNSGSEDVSVLLGNGDGTFQPQKQFAAGVFLG